MTFSRTFSEQYSIPFSSKWHPNTFSVARGDYPSYM